MKFKIIIIPFILSCTEAFTPSLLSRSLMRSPIAGVLNNQCHQRYTSADIMLQIATAPVPSRRRKPSLDPKSENENTTHPSVLEIVSENYQQLTVKHYLVMAFLQAGVLASGADTVTQMLENANPINFAHVAAMAVVASTMSGLMNAVWLRQLENGFPGTEFKEVASKTLIHAIIIASIINSAYLAFVPSLTTWFLEGGGLSDSASGAITSTDVSTIFSGWSLNEFIILTKLEVLMFIPYNTVAFKFIPPSVRPLTHAAVSATFNIAVSAVTLGYFDAWCQRAMHIFG